MAKSGDAFFINEALNGIVGFIRLNASRDSVHYIHRIVYA